MGEGKILEILDPSTIAFLLLAGFIAAFIDSTVGGGGLISTPALLAAVVQFSKKREATGEPEQTAFENVSVSTEAENTDTEDTENGTASEEAQDDMQDDTQGWQS